MIKQVFDPEELDVLINNQENFGVEAQKIYALLLCYETKYDFCRFYASENAVIASLYGDHVVCETGGCNLDDRDFEELAEFFSFCGFSEIFCSEKVGERLSEKLECTRKKLNLMRFCGNSVPRGTEKTPPLSEIYGVLKTAFEIDYEQWYLDMSHRIRHGITQFRRLDGAVLAIQHNLNGNALLSQIATSPELRGQGRASRLIKAVCGELSDSSVFVLCEDGLLSFYQRLGFSLRSVNYQLSSR